MAKIFLIRIFFVATVVMGSAFVGYYAKVLNILPQQGNKQPAALIKAKDINIDPNELYKVTEVLDGDTFKVKIDSKEVTVRMLGINTPETIDPRKPPECFGKEASEETKSLLNHRQVKLALNPNREKTDKYGRILGYVYRDDGLFVNELLIKQGFAREYTVGKPYQFQKEFKDDQKEAKNAQKGLWSACVNRS
jgi:micrococcal nuclease